MRTVCLIIRGCPAEVHAALELSAAANRRSLNAETITWLSRQATAQASRPTERELERRLQKLESQWQTQMIAGGRDTLIAER